MQAEPALQGVQRYRVIYRTIGAGREQQGAPLQPPQFVIGQLATDIDGGASEVVAACENLHHDGSTNTHVYLFPKQG